MKAMDFVEGYPRRALSAWDMWKITSVEADYPLFLTIVTALPYPSQAYHQAQHLSLRSGDPIPGIVRG